jgi:hypothetical protein
MYTTANTYVIYMYIYNYMCIYWGMYICIYDVLSSMVIRLHLALKSMVVWLERFWGYLAFANEVSRLATCPIHCHPSCLPWLVSGCLIGFLLAICLVAVLAFLWIYRLALLRFLTVPVPSGPRPRLARYLE